MVNLTQAWAEEFMKRNPGTSIAVTGGGSGTGISSLLSNTCDIAQVSREMKEAEIETGPQQRGSNPRRSWWHSMDSRSSSIPPIPSPN